MLAAAGRMPRRLPARHAMVAPREASERCGCVGSHLTHLAHCVVTAPHMSETREPVSRQRQGKDEQGQDSEPAHHGNQIPNFKRCQSTATAGVRISLKRPLSLTSRVSQRLGLVDGRTRTRVVAGLWRGSRGEG